MKRKLLVTLIPVILLVLVVVFLTRSIELKGTYYTILSTPENPAPSGYKLDYSKGSVYLIMPKNVKQNFIYDDVLVVVRGRYDPLNILLRRNLFYVESIGIDAENPYMKERDYCMTDNDCWGGISGKRSPSCKTECINSFHRFYGVASGDYCSYYSQELYSLEGGECKCINDKCTLTKNPMEKNGN